MNFRRAIPLAFAGVTVVFLLATGLSQTWALSIDARAREIASVAAPSVRHLAAAAAEFRHLKALMAAAEKTRRRPRGVEIDNAHRALDAELSAYLDIPLGPNERGEWRRLGEDLRAIDAALASDDVGAVTTSFGAAAERMSADLERTLELHASLAHDDALAIERLHEQTLTLLLGLDGLGVLITLGAAMIVGRGVEQHVRLQETNARLLRDQVAELEAFSGRVAHDILGPLGGVSLAIESVGRAHPDDARAARTLTRARSCVGAVERVVRDLLEFARAGARPDPDQRADVSAAVAQALADAQVEASASDVLLRAEVAPTLEAAACTQGVLLSLCENLVRNAVKHMGACSTRQVVVRALPAGPFVRVEVADTGPGLAPEFVAVAFQPHVRGRGVAVSGLGLGLATVKRLVEAHGGRVGVVSAPGAGSTFWFEFPPPRTVVPPPDTTKGWGA